MSTRRKSPNMPPSRTRTSVEAHQRTPRHVSGTIPQATYAAYPPYQSEMSNSHFELVSGPAGFYPQDTNCWTPMDDAFYPGSDSAHIPTLSVAPGDLTHQPAFDVNLDAATLYDASSSSSSSGCSNRSSISPPMTEAEIVSCGNVYYPGTTQPATFPYSQYPDPLWINHGMLTPPLFPDTVDLFNSGKDDPSMFETLPEPVQECEYLGVSKLQFARTVPRLSQHRPILSASEKNYNTPVSGSPERPYVKDEPVEKAKNNPRDDPLYEAKPDKDGYYHCPFTHEGTCAHKATKQKCIYAKNLDSHLKPYTCKSLEDENCRTLRFSSNACLFRHEREMHGLHNHGKNPYLCKFQGCERAHPDNGFPRRWNQRDHMKRVHGWDEPDNNDDAADRGYTDASRRRKGPGVSNSVAMKRTGSSRAQMNYYHGQQRNVSAPRYLAQRERELQTQGIMIPGMPVDDVNFPSHQVMTQPYGNGLYMQAAY